jgi:hypothetical protein
MSLRKILVGFFILLFSFQLVPVQQVGSLLYSNQIMEEMPHSQDTGYLKFADDNIKHYDYTLFVSCQKEIISGYFLTGKAADMKITTRSSDDIQTPPPNDAL